MQGEAYKRSISVDLGIFRMYEYSFRCNMYEPNVVCIFIPFLSPVNGM